MAEIGLSGSGVHPLADLWLGKQNWLKDDSSHLTQMVWGDTSQKREAFFFFLSFSFRPRHKVLVACGILVPRPGIESAPLSVKVQSANYWTAREFPREAFIIKMTIDFYQDNSFRKGN